MYISTFKILGGLLLGSSCLYLVFFRFAQQNASCTLIVKGGVLNNLKSLMPEDRSCPVLFSSRYFRMACQAAAGLAGRGWAGCCLGLHADTSLMSQLLSKWAPVMFLWGFNHLLQSLPVLACAHYTQSQNAGCFLLLLLFLYKTQEQLYAILFFSSCFWTFLAWVETWGDWWKTLLLYLLLKFTFN